MKVKIVRGNRPHYTIGNVYKVEGKTRNTFLLINDKGYLRSVKSDDCEVLGFLKGLFK